MTNIYTLQSEDERYDEASLWLAKLERSLTEEEEVALKAWLLASEENREAFFEIAKVWDKLDALSRLSLLFPDDSVHIKPNKWQLQIALAASIVFAFTFTFWLFDGVITNESQNDVNLRAELNFQNTINVYETAIGEYSTITLSDDTRVTLNTNTLLRVNYTSKQRNFILERGEILVDVSHDPDRPLLVQVSNKIIQAVGTTFYIELHSNQNIEVIVTDGRVTVGVNENPGSNSFNSITPIVDASSITLRKGEKLFVNSLVEEVEEVEPEEIVVRLSWREGNLIFRGESLENAVSEISRYTPVEFIFLDEHLKQLKVTGLFKAGDVEGLLTTLKTNFNINYQQNEEVVLLGVE